VSELELEPIELQADQITVDGWRNGTEPEHLGDVPFTLQITMYVPHGPNDCSATVSSFMLNRIHYVARNRLAMADPAGTPRPAMRPFMCGTLCRRAQRAKGGSTWCLAAAVLRLS